MLKKKLYGIVATLAMLVLSGCSDQPERAEEIPSSPPPPMVTPKEPEQDFAVAPTVTEGGWIDYTPKYLWVYSSQFHEGFENITDRDRILKAVRLINAAPLVPEAEKQQRWGILQFATGEMQIHVSGEYVYLIFGGLVKKTDDQLLQVLGIEELPAPAN